MYAIASMFSAQQSFSEWNLLYVSLLPFHVIDIFLKINLTTLFRSQLYNKASLDAHIWHKIADDLMVGQDPGAMPSSGAH